MAPPFEKRGSDSRLVSAIEAIAARQSRQEDRAALFEFTHLYKEVSVDLERLRFSRLPAAQGAPTYMVKPCRDAGCTIPLVDMSLWCAAHAQEVVTSYTQKRDAYKIAMDEADKIISGTLAAIQRSRVPITVVPAVTSRTPGAPRTQPDHKVLTLEEILATPAAALKTLKGRGVKR
jgi:hypothetical protein